MFQKFITKIMYAIHLKLSVAATILFEIHLWCWHSKNTSVTVSAWWTVPGWLLVSFVSWHLGWIWNFIFHVYLILYVPHASFFKKYSKHCDMLNSLAGTRLQGTLGWNPLSYKKPQKIIIDAFSLGECRNPWILDTNSSLNKAAIAWRHNTIWCFSIEMNNFFG